MIWLDAQLSPALADWIATELRQPAQAIRVLGFRNATDAEIFEAARKANVIVMTKDADFITLLERLGPPPQVIWLTCGNTSNAALQTILQRALPQSLAILNSGEALVEIAG
jgi:predicted nuclease of predicted toxin-antitoxin system